jgi:mono/diheme cytochrome c family protein
MGRGYATTISVAALLSFIVASGAYGQKPTPDKLDATSSVPKNPVAATPKSIDAGKSTFQKYCRPCHNDDAKGDGPMAPQGTHPPNLVDATWDHGSTDGDIYTVIKNGIGPAFDMKGYNSRLTPQEIWNVVNYLRSLGSQGQER